MNSIKCSKYLYNRSLYSIWRTEFFVERINIDLLRKGRVSFILHVIKSPWSITNWIWSWLGWLEKLGSSNNFSFWLLNSFPFWLSINFRTQFLCPIVTLWDLWWRPRWHVYFFVSDFSSFQSNNFWNTISWKNSLKDDCIRSSLIECQSFPDRKIDVDPIYRVLMSLPCIVQVLCTTWYIQVNLFKIVVTFVPRTNRQEENCLSLAWILTSRY